LLETSLLLLQFGMGRLQGPVDLFEFSLLGSGLGLEFLMDALELVALCVVAAAETLRDALAPVEQRGRLFGLLLGLVLLGLGGLVKLLPPLPQLVILGIQRFLAPIQFATIRVELFLSMLKVDQMLLQLGPLLFELRGLVVELLLARIQLLVALGALRFGLLKAVVQFRLAFEQLDFTAVQITAQLLGGFAQLLGHFLLLIELGLPLLKLGVAVLDLGVARNRRVALMTQFGRDPLDLFREFLLDAFEARTMGRGELVDSIALFG
jgi:hypothetical protein